ncbi:PIG-L family deacetylase [Nocardioides campestrisoli]|uniref:PIG-L family deacetylase n=1 Tax=Nocardioides campestrisoli TaxID=2736757 RepID=UPI00163D5A20|nr:PIG-L family deacetylase [Nocardioides campestrisoli]
MAEEQLRALVLEDAEDSAAFIRIALTRHGGFAVDVAGTADEALALLRPGAYDVLISDIMLPGRSGLEILPTVRRVDPDLAIIILTAYPTFDNAVVALRESADEFLTKPVPTSALVERATELARVTRQRRGGKQQRVLAVGSHPDDVEIGIGATLAAHAAAGDDLTIMIMSGGAVGGDTQDRRSEAANAAAVVGARLIHLEYPDTHLVPAEGLITSVEQVVAAVDPDRIYTHGVHDRHQDHRAVHSAVEIGARGVPSIWCFQSPSSTVDFAPNRFVDVEGFVETKLKMLAAFVSQSHREYMQPDVVRTTARYWARFSPAREVEPLETVRATDTLVPAHAVTGQPAMDGQGADTGHGYEEDAGAGGGDTGRE